MAIYQAIHSVHENGFIRLNILVEQAIILFLWLNSLDISRNLVAQTRPCGHFGPMNGIDPQILPDIPVIWKIRIVKVQMNVSSATFHVFSLIVELFPAIERLWDGTEPVAVQ